MKTLPGMEDSTLEKIAAWGVESGELAHPHADETPDLQTAAVHAALRSFVMHPDFPCVGASSAFHRDSYRFGLYPSLATTDGDDALARDLRDFASFETGDDFRTFVACFAEPRTVSAGQFERLLWEQLQRLHASDEAAWSEGYSSDPESPHFAWSFHGTAYFVIGLSPASPRTARRFPFPALVFNPHEQFERLRASGKFERMQEVIRQRDLALEGEPNPELADYGSRSEARQYSGCPHDDEWVAPFVAELAEPNPNSEDR